MSSYFDYKEGSATTEYRRSVDEAARIAEEQKRNGTCKLGGMCYTYPSVIKNDFCL